MRWSLLLVSTVALSPTAVAAAAEGRLDVQNDVVLPAGAELRSGPLAVFLPAAGELESLAGEAASLKVQVFEKRYLTTTIGSLRPSLAIANDRPQWTTADVVITAIGAREGWIGLDVKAGQLIESANEPLTIRVENAPTVGNGVAGSEANDPEHLGYRVEVDGAALRRTAREWAYEGSGTLRMIGPTLVLRSRTNTTTIETGQFEDPSAPGQMVRRWVALSFEAGSIRTRGPTDVASRTAVATWDGPLHLPGARGTLAGPLREWRAHGTPGTIDGEFTATISPASASTITLAIAGDLRSTTLGSRVHAPTAGTGIFGVLLLVLGVLAIAVGGAARHSRRGRRAHALEAEDYAALADLAADTEEYDKAAALAAKARTFSPTSRRLALDHAFYVFQSGAHEHALAILRDELIRDDPDALTLEARIHLKRNDDQAAASALARALSAAPIALFDIESDPAFEALMTHAEVREAARRARRSLE